LATCTSYQGKSRGREKRREVDLDDGARRERRDERRLGGGGQVKFKIRITAEAASGKRGCG
jgi:hypothetical protein